MKFTSFFRSSLAAATSLALGLGTTACSRDYTAAYVYATSASTGSVSAYAVDYQSGILTQISGSPFAGQVGANPVTLVADSTNENLYVIGGTQSSAVEWFKIGTDGKLYGQSTKNISPDGSYPTAAAISPDNKYLYVLFQYQSPYTPANPGPGGITVFSLNTGGGINQIVNAPSGKDYYPVGNNPVGIAVSQPTATNTGVPGGNVYLYVLDQEGSTASPTAQPTVMGFQEVESSSSVTLSLLSGTVSSLGTYQGTNAGVTPSAIAIDPTSRYVYVTDKAANEIYSYQLGNPNNGNLTALTSSGTQQTGLYPVSVVVDPRGKYVYTANYNSNTVSAFAINTATGSLGGTATGNFTTATGPTCVTIDPALGVYVYTSNYLDSSISAAKLSPNTGQLTAVANTPFVSAAEPSCVVSVANGSHASSIDNP